MSECKYILKEEVNPKKRFIYDVLKNVQKDFRKKWKFSFSPQLVGSAKRKLVIRKGKSPWDMDFQLKMVSAKVKVYTKSKDLFNIKNDIKTLLNKHTNKDYSAKLSKSVVTLTQMDSKGKNTIMSYDFAIINWKSKILRHKTITDCKWEDVKKHPEAIARYNEIIGPKMWKKFRKKYLNHKCEEYDKTHDNKLPGDSILAIAIKETLE